MRRRIFAALLFPFILVGISGCVPLIIGGAVGALGGYAVSRDTIQGDTDKSYERLWNATVSISKVRGSLKQEDSIKGLVQFDSEDGRVWIRLIRVTQSTTRLRVSARKHRLPNLTLAQDIFVRIMEAAK